MGTQFLGNPKVRSLAGFSSRGHEESDRAEVT